MKLTKPLCKSNATRPVMRALTVKVYIDPTGWLYIIRALDDRLIATSHGVWPLGFPASGQACADLALSYAMRRVASDYPSATVAAARCKYLSPENAIALGVAA